MSSPSDFKDLTIPQLLRALSDMNIQVPRDRTKAYYIYKLQQARIQEERQDWEWISSHDENQFKSERPRTQQFTRSRSPILQEIQNKTPYHLRSSYRDRSPRREGSKNSRPINMQHQRKQRSISPPPVYKEFKQPPPPEMNTYGYSTASNTYRGQKTNTMSSGVSTERRSRSREMKPRVSELYQDIKRPRKEQTSSPPDNQPKKLTEEQKRIKIQRLREQYIQKETRSSFFHDICLFFFVFTIIALISFIGYNFYHALRNPVYCQALKIKPRQINEGPISKLLNFVAMQGDCAACPEHGECETGKLQCKCPYIERFGECVEDPNQETQIQAFVENLLTTLQQSGGEKICEGGSEIKDSYSSQEIIALFHEELGGRCNVRSMERRLEEVIYSRAQEFEIEKQDNLTKYRAKTPELSYECQINIFLRDNVLAIIIGSISMLYIVFRFRVCYMRCKWRQKARTIFADLKHQLELGRVEQDEVLGQCGDEEGVIDEFQKLVSRDRSVSRFQKVVSGRPTFFLERRK